MTEVKRNQIWARTFHGEIPLHKLVKKPQKKYNIFSVAIVQIMLVILGVYSWNYAYIRILTGKLPDHLLEWKVTLYLLWLWMITNVVLLLGKWFFKLLVWKRSENFLRKGAYIYYFELEKCPQCGKKLELYRKGEQLMFHCLSSRDYNYYTQCGKILELLEEDQRISKSIR